MDWLFLQDVLSLAVPTTQNSCDTAVVFYPPWLQDTVLHRAIHSGSEDARWTVTAIGAGNSHRCIAHNTQIHPAFTQKFIQKWHVKCLYMGVIVWLSMLIFGYRRSIHRRSSAPQGVESVGAMCSGLWSKPIFTETKGSVEVSTTFPSD